MHRCSQRCVDRISSVSCELSLLAQTFSNFMQIKAKALGHWNKWTTSNKAQTYNTQWEKFHNISEHRPTGGVAKKQRTLWRERQNRWCYVTMSNNKRLTPRHKRFQCDVQSSDTTNVWVEQVLRSNEAGDAKSNIFSGNSGQLNAGLCAVQWQCRHEGESCHLQK